MAIPGRSGQETQVAAFITDQLRRAGVASELLQSDNAHRRSPLGGECGNLILKLPGTKRAPRRLLSAHMDTVPICVGCQPVRRGNTVRAASSQTGLGADNRAGCAVLLHTAMEIYRRDLPHPPLTFCWTVQEEVGLVGARYLRRPLLGNPQLGFNFDGGSAAKLTIGATGGYRLTARVQGLASHAGGAPEQGISAIAIAALAIADLQRSGWHGQICRDGHQGTCNVGHICGGEATNVVADQAVVRAEARSHDAAFRQRIVAEIEECFSRAARSVSNVAGRCGTVDIAGSLDYESYRLPADAPCVAMAADAVRAVGRQPEVAITHGGLDTNWLVHHGIPAVSLGCGQRNQHTRAESLDLREFADACLIALQLATLSEP
jgi:tripeptide aminopeptidase